MFNSSMLCVLRAFENNEALSCYDMNYDFFTLVSTKDAKIYSKAKPGHDYFILLVNSEEEANFLFSRGMQLHNIIKWGLLDCRKYHIDVNLGLVLKGETIKERDYYIFLNNKPGLLYFPESKLYERPTFFQILTPNMRI